MFREPSEAIALTTYNQFGPFTFYVSYEKLQHYVEAHYTEFSVEAFLAICTWEQARALFDWLKRPILNEGEGEE